MNLTPTTLVETHGGRQRTRCDMAKTPRWSDDGKWHPKEGDLVWLDGKDDNPIHVIRRCTCCKKGLIVPWISTLPIVKCAKCQQPCS